MIDRVNLSDFVSRRALPVAYARSAEKWFLPVMEDIVSLRKRYDRPDVVGISGAQGSGKST